MRTQSKKPAFLIASRVLVLLYVAALLQLCSTVSCACAESDSSGYEDTALFDQAADVLPSCCSVKSGSEVDGLTNNRFDGSIGVLCGVQAPRCCVLNNDSLDPDVWAAVGSIELPLNFKDVFRTLTPSFSMAHDPHGAYSKVYYAEVVSFSVPRHIASTILLL